MTRAPYALGDRTARPRAAINATRRTYADTESPSARAARSSRARSSGSTRTPTTTLRPERRGVDVCVGTRCERREAMPAS